MAKGLVRLGLIESGEATFDPPDGMKCPSGGCLQSRLFALHGYGGHGIGLEVDDPAQYYDGQHQFAVGDVLPWSLGVYVSPDLLGSLPDTRQTAPCGQDSQGGRQVPVHRGADRGRLRVDRQRAPVVVVGCAREISEIEALMRQREPELPGGGSCGRPKM